MKQFFYSLMTSLLLSMQCKSISTVKQNPILLNACPNFGFLELTEEQINQGYSFKYYGDWQERQALESASGNKNDKKMYDEYVLSKKVERTNSQDFELAIIALKSSKDETVIVPLELAIKAKTAVDSQNAMNAWKHFYFRLCPDEKEVKNFNQTEYATKVLRIKEELISSYGTKSIKELTTHIMKIDKLIYEARGSADDLMLKKRVAWQWFLERLDNTTRNYIKIKYPKFVPLTEKSVSFFDRNDYPQNLFVFHTMFRILFRENPSSPGGIAESTFRLEQVPKSKSFNLIHTILRNDNTEYPIANIFFLEEGDEVLITKLLEEKKTEISPNWEYVTVQFFNEIVGIMGSYDFDLRYVNSSRFDQYEPKGK